MRTHPGLKSLTRGSAGDVVVPHAAGTSSPVARESFAGGSVGPFTLRTVGDVESPVCVAPRWPRR